jgi:hypothetical protein
MDAPLQPQPHIGIVGPCSAGKSTLARCLTELGAHAKSIGQEHSYVPHMWQVIGRPDVLIFLDVSYPVAQLRRWLNWQPADLDEQHHRLRHARAHCDYYLDTDPFSVQQVCDQAVAFLIQRSASSGIMPPP